MFPISPVRESSSSQTRKSIRGPEVYTEPQCFHRTSPNLLGPESNKAFRLGGIGGAGGVSARAETLLERVVNFSVYAIITSANEASATVLTSPLRSTEHMWRRATNAD